MSSGEAHREGVSNAFALSAWCAWVLCGVASYGYRVERGNLGYNFTLLPLTSYRSNPRRLRYAVFTKNYRETVLFKIMKELVPLGYDTENAALPNGFM